MDILAKATLISSKGGFMKNLIISSLLLWSIKGLAIAVPQNCERLLNGSDYLLDGYVESIAEEKECITSNCSSYDINYTARFIVNKSIKGNIEPDSIIYIKYKDVFHSAEDNFGPSFQGHDPKPKASENWKIFVDRHGANTFIVAPPNGWWPSENVECWLDTSAKPILERNHEEIWNLIDNITYVRSYTITVYSDGAVYSTVKSEYEPGKKKLLATLSPEALSDITYIIAAMEPGNISFSEDATCVDPELINYRVIKSDFIFESFLFAQANECKKGYLESDDDVEDLLRIQKILDGFSSFFDN
jgi:hypothetical protein